MTMDRKHTDRMQTFAERTASLKTFQQSLQPKKQKESIESLSTSTLWGISLPIAIPTSLDEVEKLAQSTLNAYQQKAEAIFDEYVEGNVPEHVKMQRELRQHYRLRDKAFFEAMAIKEPDIQPVTDTFKIKNATRLTSPLDMLTEVKAFKATKDKELILLEQQLKMLLTAKRNWIISFIEHYAPSFILKYFNYESLQTKVHRQVETTTQAYADIKDEINALQQELAEHYDNVYKMILPEDLDTYQTTLENNERLLSAYIEDQRNAALKTAYQQFLTDKTVGNMEEFYQLLCQMTHDDELTHTTATTLIVQLYPEFTPYCYTIQKQVRTEQNILALITQKYTTQKPESIYGLFLNELHGYYQKFLTEPSVPHLKSLYAHITTPVTHKKNSLLMQVMTYLETYYAQPLKGIKGTPIADINTNACLSLIEQTNLSEDRTETMSIALKFLSLPTWENLSALERALKDYDYHTEPTTVALIEQLMDMCLSPSQSIAINADINAEIDTMHDREPADFTCVASKEDANKWITQSYLPISEEPLSDYPTFSVESVSVGDLESTKKDRYTTTLQYSVALLQTPSQEPVYSSLVTLRDRAFFEHLSACELKIYRERINENLSLTDFSQLVIQPALINDAMPALPSALRVLQNYRATHQQLTAELDAVNAQMVMLEEQKPEHVIHSITDMLNEFTSGLIFLYCLQVLSNLITQSFKTINLPERKALVTQRNQLKDDIYKAKVAFEHQWSAAYHRDVPKHPESEAEELQMLVSIMQDTLLQSGNVKLTEHFQKWFDTSTETTVTALYQQLCIEHYYSPHNAVFTDSMMTLHRLYPDLSLSLLDTEQQITTQLYQNDQMYRIAMAIPDYEMESVMLPLQKKLKQFLNTKAEYPFVILYQDLISNSAYQTLPQAQQLLIALQTLYPEMVSRFTTAQTERIAHINSATSSELYLAYYTLKTNNPVFEAVKLCLSNPTWQHIKDLRLAMAAHPEYSQDPKLAKLVCSFMEASLDAPEDLTFAKDEHLSSQAKYNYRMGFFGYRSEQCPTPSLQQHVQPLLAYTADPKEQREIATEAAIRKLNAGMQKITDAYLNTLEEEPNTGLNLRVASQIESLMRVYEDVLNNNPLPQNIQELKIYRQFSEDLSTIKRIIAYQKYNSEEFKRLDANLKQKLDQLAAYPDSYRAAEMLFKMLKATSDYRSAYAVADHPRIIEELQELQSAYLASNF